MVVDIQFKVLKDNDSLGLSINAVSRGEHATKVERWHRVIKECGRFYYSMLSCRHFPWMMVVQLMTTMVFYANAFV